MQFLRCGPCTSVNHEKCLNLDHDARNRACVCVCVSIDRSLIIIYVRTTKTGHVRSPYRQRNVSIRSHKRLCGETAATDKTNCERAREDDRTRFSPFSHIINIISFKILTITR